MLAVLRLLVHLDLSGRREILQHLRHHLLRALFR
jgi:hypothetical protein